MSKKRTHEEYISELKIKNPTIEVVGKYIDSQTKIMHHCLIHDVYWEISPQGALKGHGCEMCHYERVSKSSAKTNDEYIMELHNKHPHIQIRSSYKGMHVKIPHYCEKHKILWNSTPSNVLKGVGCRECRKESYVLKRSKTQDEYINEVAIKNPSVKVIGTYSGVKVSILHYCTRHNVFWCATPNNILHGHGCEMCGSDKIRNSRLKTRDYYIKQLSIKNPDVELIGEYINMRTATLHHCLLDDVYWNATPYNVLKGCGCPECHKRKIGDKNRKTPEQYNKDVQNIHMHIKPIEDYIDSYTPILHKCSQCGAVWRPIPHNILCGRGCPGCTQSYKEQQISKWLFENNITYIPEHTFNDCKYKKLLPFDFYLPDYNMCIEYDGEQHYKPIDFSGRGYEHAIEQLKIIQLRDSIKTAYCKSNNITLLRIPYWEVIDSVLSKIFLI